MNFQTFKELTLYMNFQNFPVNSLQGEFVIIREFILVIIFMIYP